VIGHFGLDVEVVLESGERRRVRLRPRADAVVVGDRVSLSPRGLEALPRRTLLARRDARDRTRAIAANLDVVGVTLAARPVAPKAFLDRAIVAARAAGILPFVVVNKCDEEDSRALAERLRGDPALRQGEIAVFGVSASTGAGLDALRAFFAAGSGPTPRRGAFVGTSGVGKSSLSNALVPGLALEVGEINRFTRLGRHVTTRATLHALPGGGELVDTPGFRDFVPVDLAPVELARHFAGFERAVEKGCRFRDCLHRDEPGCAVVESLAPGPDDAERGVDPAQVTEGELELVPGSAYRAYLALLEDIERAHAADIVRRRPR
jgi:ribosome biogenesis GTPase